MAESLCIIEPCYIRGRHTNDGCAADCNGCLPGLALDGLRICRHHHDRALRDLRRLPGLDAALGLALTRPGKYGQDKIKHTSTTGIVLNENVMEERELIRERLTDFIAYAIHEWGVVGPNRWTVEAMVGWLIPWHDRFCASKMAPAYVRNLDQHTRRAHGLAHPSGARAFPVGPCTEHTTSDDGERIPCTGTLTAILRDNTNMLPSELTCDGPEPHTFAPHEWMAIGRRIHGVHPDGVKALTDRINRTA